MHEYKIIAFDEDEIPLLEYVQANKLGGFVYPNMPGGALFVLPLDDDTALHIRLKYRLKIFGKSSRSDS